MLLPGLRNSSCSRCSFVLGGTRRRSKRKRQPYMGRGWLLFEDSLPLGARLPPSRVGGRHVDLAPRSDVVQPFSARRASPSIRCAAASCAARSRRAPPLARAAPALLVVVPLFLSVAPDQVLCAARARRTSLAIVGRRRRRPVYRTLGPPAPFLQDATHCL